MTTEGAEAGGLMTERSEAVGLTTEGPETGGLMTERSETVGLMTEGPETGRIVAGLLPERRPEAGGAVGGPVGAESSRPLKK